MNHSPLATLRKPRRCEVQVAHHGLSGLVQDARHQVITAGMPRAWSHVQTRRSACGQQQVLALLGKEVAGPTREGAHP
jgi:hypothetical protein